MKKNLLVPAFFFCMLSFESCSEHFQTWKDYNENYLTTTTADESLSVSPTGLRTKIFFQGIGSKPKSNSLVKVKYTAVLSDGVACTTIDTVNYVYNFPAGLQEALLQMNRESIWQICMPYDLAYGKTGTKNSYGNYVIPPYTTIFISKFELVEVVNY